MTNMTNNRQTGFMCNFYTDRGELELRIRAGFEDIAKDNGTRVKKNGHGEDWTILQGISYLELEGARLFRGKFGKSKTHDGALKLIIDMGLAEDESHAKKVLDYMVKNDIPYRDRHLFDFNDWSRFTLVPDENKRRYTVEGYRATIGDFFRSWNAMASFCD